MRTTAFIAAIFVLASFLSGSIDNAATAVAFAKPEPAPFLTYRAIGRLQLYKRTPQRSKGGDQNGGKSGDENAGRGAGRGANRGADRGANRDGNGNENGSNRDGNRQNNNGKARDDGGNANNNENAANNNQDPIEEATSTDDVEADPNANDTAANETSGNSASAEGDTDSNVYNGPSSVNTKGVQNGTVIAAVAVSALVLVCASAIVFMRRKKHVEQTEAIIEKSASAFVQQNNAYEALDDSPLPIGTYTVVSRFTPNLEDELEVDAGDMITVIIEYDDGWVQGINESRGGQKGVMPRHCLNMSSKYAISKRSSSIGFTSVNL